MGGFNLNWDASWTVATSADSAGWYAEMRIPFSTLRYRRRRHPESGASTWCAGSADGMRSPSGRPFHASSTSCGSRWPVRLEEIQVPSRRVATVTPYVARRREKGMDARARDRLSLRGRRRREVRTHAEPHAGPDLQHRLRAGGGGRGPLQPHPVSPLLSRRSGRSSWRTPASSRRARRRPPISSSAAAIGLNDSGADGADHRWRAAHRQGRPVSRWACCSSSPTTWSRSRSATATPLRERTRELGRPLPHRRHFRAAHLHRRTATTTIAPTASTDGSRSVMR